MRIIIYNEGTDKIHFDKKIKAKEKIEMDFPVPPKKISIVIVKKNNEDNLVIGLS